MDFDCDSIYSVAQTLYGISYDLWHYEYRHHRSSFIFHQLQCQTSESRCSWSVSVDNETKRILSWRDVAETIILFSHRRVTNDEIEINGQKMIEWYGMTKQWEIPFLTDEDDLEPLVAHNVHPNRVLFTHFYAIDEWINEIMINDESNRRISSAKATEICNDDVILSFFESN